MIKTAVSSARNVGIRLKKRRFLKLFFNFVGIKQGYNADYQHFVRNTKNKRFSATNDNAPANIGCTCGQNSLFVKFIRICRRGVIYHVPPSAMGLFLEHWIDYCFHGGRRNVINHALTADALVFLARRNMINHASATGVCRLFYAMLIPNWGLRNI